jgi:cytochrome P450
MTDSNALGAGMDPEALAHPQPLYGMMRDVGAVVDLGPDMNMVLIGRDEDARHVLAHPEIFSSGIDAVHIGQVRPLIPLQIDPPKHRNYRRLLDPIFAPKQIAPLEEATRALVRELLAPLKSASGCNFHTALAEPLPSTVFLQLLGLPTSRAAEFIELKNGIIRPVFSTPEERIAAVDATGAKIYEVLQEVIEERASDPQSDFISMFLGAEVDGERLTHEDVLDIGYLFFIAGLDTVTASLDCMIAYLAQHPAQRQRLVDDPSLIPNAIEEMLRWESPVAGIVRITTQATEVAGCPIEAGKVVSVMLGSANTDERFWEGADEVDFDRAVNRHIAFGGGVHRCLGSNLARMELRVALEEWHRSIPEYRLADGNVLLYSQGLRAIDNLELVW